jgi:hypothetical protein
MPIILAINTCGYIPNYRSSAGLSCAGSNPLQYKERVMNNNKLDDDTTIDLGAVTRETKGPSALGVQDGPGQLCYIPFGISED